MRVLENIAVENFLPWERHTCDLVPIKGKGAKFSGYSFTHSLIKNVTNYSEEKNMHFINLTFRMLVNIRVKK